MAQTEDQVGNQAAWTTLFTLMYDGQPPLITDTSPSGGSVITNAWPVISATLSDPEPGSGACPEHCRRVEPLSTTLILDSEVVTPQVNTAEGFAYTPTQKLAEGEHSATARAYDVAGNQTETGPWTFNVVGPGKQRHHPAPGLDQRHHLTHQHLPPARRGLAALPGRLERG
jgi:hypothetical protein